MFKLRPVPHSRWPWPRLAAGSLFAILWTIASAPAATSAEKATRTDRSGEVFTMMNEYLAHDVPGIRFDAVPVSGAVDKVDELARTAGLDKLGYRGLSIARSKADIAADGIETITARLETGPFVNVLELVANQLGCYVVEYAGIVILMPVAVLDASMTPGAYRLSTKVCDVLGISARSSEKEILASLAKFNLRLRSVSSARVTENGRYLVLWTKRDEALLVDAFFTLIERNVIPPRPTPAKHGTVRSKR